MLYSLKSEFALMSNGRFADKLGVLDVRAYPIPKNVVLRTNFDAQFDTKI